VIIVLSQADKIDELWILEEIPRCISRGAAVLGYAHQTSAQDIEVLKTSIPTVRQMTDCDSFGETLREDIDRLRSQG
jgi:hypothetical protein